MNKLPKISIIIQGPSKYVPEIKNAWKDFKDDLIFSTWAGSENEYEKTDNVIFNIEPLSPGPLNFNYQKKSTYNGLLKAKETGYSHALKIRSDYLPTNATEFIKILKLDKLNFLMWHYTSFLWSAYPSFNGYLNDHISFGPIDNMIDLWNIPDNFCGSPEIMLTWSYISKLKNIIGVHYFLNDLNENNDLFYIKPDGPESYGFLDYKTDFSDRFFRGRYDSMFKTSRMNTETGKSEYTKSPKETEKYMNDRYLNFLKYYNPLPKITIFGEYKNVIYPENKLEIVSDINEIHGDYVISSKNILTAATLIIEFFKKKNIIYTSTITNSPEHNKNICYLLSKDEFINKLKTND